MYQQEREELCCIAKMLFDKNLASGTDGNISMRLPDNRMLITPSGINKGLLRPEQLLVQDYEGNVLEGTLRSTKEAGMHAILYETRPEVGAIVHTHPAAATAFAACGMTIPDNILIEIGTLIGKMAVVPFAKPGSRELAEGVREAAKECSIFLLQNHGVVVGGKNLIDAFNKMDGMENAAKSILYAKILGKVKEIEE